MVLITNSDVSIIGGPRRYWGEHRARCQETAHTSSAENALAPAAVHEQATTATLWILHLC